ncbi:MAG: Zn-ribbon domain-containing OB-fold protein [Rhodoferax sp.]
MTIIERVMPAPGTNIENQPYWDAAAEGRLMLKFCTACGKYHHYPRALCPHCLSDQTEWRQVSGKGSIYSYSVMRRVPQPYALAYIALEEGVTMMCGVVDADLDALKIGMPVHVAFRKTDGDVIVPVFVPA